MISQNGIFSFNIENEAMGHMTMADNQVRSLKLWKIPTHNHLLLPHSSNSDSGGATDLERSELLQVSSGHSPVCKAFFSFTYG